jgi:protein-disulfide isomerase
VSTESREQRRAAARAAREQAERDAARSDSRNRRLMQLGGVLVAAAVIVVAAVLIFGGGGGNGNGPAKQPGEQVAGQNQINSQLAGIPQQGINLGKRNAPVTVVEFGDLQCPACAAFSAQLLGPMIDGYVRPGKVRWEFRDIHFLGPDSVRLGRFAAAAGEQGKLYQTAELIWANQGQENSGYATDAFMRKIGRAVDGLNVEKAMAARDTPKVAQQLGAAQTLAGIHGIDSTPTFLVGRTGGTMQKVGGGDLSGVLQKLAGKPKSQS